MFNASGPQVSGHHLVCRSCLKRTLQKLEAMMSVLQAETAAGTGTPIAIADSILNITGMGDCGDLGVGLPYQPQSSLTPSSTHRRPHPSGQYRHAGPTTPRAGG